ncbi:MAG: hypothetical protein NUW07_00270 [Candidatus Saccharicenans sp.]|nr:hypothetical protein [Candidatus Saccharicenans sp.]MDH7492352.1 hypothetical protein [Candidatus Saccharicenans sp.]
MKERALLFLILFITATALSVEARPAIRLWGGLDWAWYAGQPGWYTFPEIGYKLGKKQGFSLGAGLEFPVAFSGLSLITELSCLQKGQEVTWYYWDEFLYREYFKLLTLSHLGLLKVKPSDSGPVFFLLGYEVSPNLRHEWHGLDIRPDTSKIGLGLVAGGGIEAKLKKFDIWAEVRYHHGITKLGKVEDYKNLRPRDLILVLGLKFRRF